MLIKMNGKELPLFPIPYPDEILYSVLCRCWIRMGRPAPRAMTETIYGVRRSTSILTPQYLDQIASLLPESTGITPTYLLYNTTVFPYFHPFLTEQRRTTFQSYFRNSAPSSSQYFALGIGKLRQPKTMYLRFCQSCWKEDEKTLGEPYWRRLHQIPGVLICPVHEDPLMDSPVRLHMAKSSYFPADMKLSETSIPCGDYSSTTAEKLISIAQDSDWLLTHGLECGSYKDTYARYTRYFYAKGFSGNLGQVRHHNIYTALQEHFGIEMLKLLNAYDESFHASWTARIPHYQNGLQHPLYHILLTELLAGSTEAFFREDHPGLLPFGPAPWPCYNPVCPGYKKDVINRYDADPYAGCMHARFECPICGMVYRRKKAMSKEEQYHRRPKVFDYGQLWRTTLRDCLVERKMTARETCNFMGCDFYTINRYALQLGLLSPDEVYLYKNKSRAKPAVAHKSTATADELRVQYRQQWTKLIEKNPTAIRSELMAMAPQCYQWLRNHDVEWYENISPPAKYSNFDWSQRDMDLMDKIRTAHQTLLNADGKPKRISKHALILEIGSFELSNKTALKKMPKTAALLDEVLESRRSWHKRKIIWAIRELQKEEKVLTPHRILQKACISVKYLEPLLSFIEEQLSQV